MKDLNPTGIGSMDLTIIIAMIGGYATGNWFPLAVLIMLILLTALLGSKE